MHVDTGCIPWPGSCLTSESSSSWKAQKFSLDLIVVLIASRACHALLHYGTFVCWGLESLSITTLEHELQLLPAFAVVVSLISLNVQGVQVVKGPGVKVFQSPNWLGELKWKVGASHWLVG